MRIFGALFSLLLGLMFPLLLNGQTFRNSLLGMAFALGSIALILGMKSDRPDRKLNPDGGRRVVGLGILLIVALGVQLPSAYQSQIQFNRKVKELRQGRIKGVPERKQAEDGVIKKITPAPTP